MGGIQEMLWVVEFCRIMELVKVGKGFKTIPSNLVPEDAVHVVFPTYLLAWNFDAFPRFFWGLIWLLLSCFSPPYPPSRPSPLPAGCHPFCHL